MARHYLKLKSSKRTRYLLALKVVYPLYFILSIVALGILFDQNRGWLALLIWIFAFYVLYSWRRSASASKRYKRCIKQGRSFIEFTDQFLVCGREATLELSYAYDTLDLRLDDEKAQLRIDLEDYKMVIPFGDLGEQGVEEARSIELSNQRKESTT